MDSRLRPRFSPTLWRQTILGALVLVAVATATGVLLAGSGQPVSRVVTWLSSNSVSLDVVFQGHQTLRLGDPLYRHRGQTLQQVGEVRSVVRSDGQTLVVVALYGDMRGLRGKHYRFTLFGPDQTLNWVVSNMWSPERRKRVNKLLTVWWHSVRSGALATVRPILIDTGRKMGQSMVRVLLAELRRRRPEIEPLLNAHRQTLEKKLQPFVQKKVIPLLMKEFTPVFTRISNTLIDRFPISKAGWSYVKDKLPWGRSDNLRSMLKKFFEREVTPTIVRFQPTFVAVGKRVVAKLMADKQLQTLFREAGVDLINDPKLLALAKRLVLKSTVQNKELRALVTAALANPRLKREAIRMARVFEPTLKSILSLMLLREDREGIDSRLALLLRSRLLYRDRIWILVEPAPSTGRAPKTWRGRIYGSR